VFPILELPNQPTPQLYAARTPHRPQAEVRSATSDVVPVMTHVLVITLQHHVLQFSALLQVCRVVLVSKSSQPTQHNFAL
jgi:hypothetical protein